MRILIALLLAWLASFILESKLDLEMANATVGLVFLAAWLMLGVVFVSGHRRR
ncbi:MAG: hypothetical protein V2J10_08230 [Wenzhouxiangella sp.]|jgi:hypothetical protein|nr:hypothetical protein [Wenzhouxiangella sp.]